MNFFLVFRFALNEARKLFKIVGEKSELNSDENSKNPVNFRSATLLKYEI